MRKLLVVLLIIAAVCACTEKKKDNANGSKSQEDIEINDSAIYGKCVEAANFSVFITTANGDTVEFIIPEDTLDFDHIKLGGLYVNDQLAILSHKSIDGENIADKIINLTTLFGEWIDEGSGKELSLTEDLSWLKNGQIIVFTDTFDIFEIGPDTLMVENKDGIMSYSRQ